MLLVVVVKSKEKKSKEDHYLIISHQQRAHTKRSSRTNTSLRRSSRLPAHRQLHEVTTAAAGSNDNQQRFPIDLGTPLKAPLVNLCSNLNSDQQQ